jgi:hypothetical protein
MTESTLVQGPWPEQAEPGRGKAWSSMWTPAADALHQELLAEWQVVGGWTRESAGDASAVLCNAAEVVRQDMPSDQHDAITEACFVFSVWLDRYAPGAGLRGLAHMLELRAAARWGTRGD